MNKKAAGFMTFITKTFIVGIVIFIFVMIIGAGGGFSAAWKAGGILNQITNILIKVPAWGWIILALIVLVNLMFGRRR